LIGVRPPSGWGMVLFGRTPGVVSQRLISACSGIGLAEAV
jgi:hypothetical protein